MKQYRFRNLQQQTSVVLFFCLLMVAAEPTLGSVEAEKISPVLREEVAFLSANPRYDYPVPVIVQVNPEFFQRNRGNHRGRGRDFDNGLSLVHGYYARLKAKQIQLLLRSPIVQYVTLNAVIHDAGKGAKKKKKKEQEEEQQDQEVEQDQEEQQQTKKKKKKKKKEEEPAPATDPVDPEGGEEGPVERTDRTPVAANPFTPPGWVAGDDPYGIGEDLDLGTLETEVPLCWGQKSAMISKG